MTQGAANAVEPSSETSSQGSSPELARARSKRSRSSSSLSKVAWIAQEDLPHSDWLATGRRFGTFGRCSQWWIGDWIRYGTSRWGAKYTDAARATGYDVASLRNMAWVASRFDLSLRDETLSWSHHVLLAPLEPEEQRVWLRRASEERLSVTDLRIELRGARREESKQDRSVEETEESLGEGAVCPHCGHALSSE
jgi:hypothetical protein